MFKSFYIHWFFDALHILKNLRNALWASKDDSKSKLSAAKNGKNPIRWKHLQDLKGVPNV